MSKELTKADLITQKEDAINNINSLLTDFINSDDKHLNKKASLLAYWINGYTNYIKKEEDFDSKKLKAYKRGDIIKLNFGFNVGSEYGGLHYAIVINNNNARNSSVLTVIPLTSQKNDDAIHPNDVSLGNEIYRNLKLKYDTISQNLQSEKDEIARMMEIFDAVLEISDKSLEAYDKNPDENIEALITARKYLDTAIEMKDEWTEKERKNNEARRQLEKIGAEIKKMKTGSIALVEQITTVSKMRIYDPRNARGVLSGIRLSPESLNKINEKLRELFIFQE